MSNALVLAGGGVAGIAWELGVFLGIQDEYPELADKVVSSDLTVGTSAGSTVAAQILSGIPLRTLYESQFSASQELPVEFNEAELISTLEGIVAHSNGAQDARRRIGRFAIDASTVGEDVRRNVIAARLPKHSWPEQPLAITAINAHSGELTMFQNNSGVSLIDAVTASCAVPGVWPPVTISGQRYVDGGIRSLTNADLARGHDFVVIITPSTKRNAGRQDALDSEILALAPAKTITIHADDLSIKAFGSNPLSPSVRAPSAINGRRIGRLYAKEVATLFDVIS